MERAGKGDAAGSVTLTFLMESNRLRRAYTRRCGQVAEEYGLKNIELDILLFLHNNAPLDTARDLSLIHI